MRRISFWVGLAFLLAVIGGGWWWLHHRAPAAAAGAGGRANRAVPVVVGSAQARDVPFYFDGIGTVQAFNTVTVHTRVDGQLIEVDYREGQEVRKGDVLAKVDPRTYQATLDQVTATQAKDQAQLTDARLDLTRYTNLGNRVTGQQFDTQKALVAQLEATVRADQATIDSARTMMSYTTIVAPIDGRTGIRQVDAGNIVHASDSNGLVVITQLQPISAIFTLPQQDLLPINQALGGLSRTDPLTVTALTSDGQTRLDSGTLTLIDNQINQSTGTITLKAAFPNANRLLWPGGFVDVRLLVRTEKNRTVVPNVAIQHGPDGAFVFTIDDESRVHITKVAVDFVEGDDAVIKEGIRAGDRLVVDGMSRLDDGSQVRTAAASGEGAANPASRPAGTAAGQRPAGQRPANPAGARRRPEGEQGGAGQADDSAAPRPAAGTTTGSGSQ